MMFLAGNWVIRQLPLVIPPSLSHHFPRCEQHCYGSENKKESISGCGENKTASDPVPKTLVLLYAQEEGFPIRSDHGTSGSGYISFFSSLFSSRIPTFVEIDPAS
jgi:hypothetical protein